MEIARGKEVYTLKELEKQLSINSNSLLYFLYISKIPITFNKNSQLRIDKESVLKLEEKLNAGKVTILNEGAINMKKTSEKETYTLKELEKLLSIRLNFILYLLYLNRVPFTYNENYKLLIDKESVLKILERPKTMERIDKIHEGKKYLQWENLKKELMIIRAKINARRAERKKIWEKEREKVRRAEKKRKRKAAEKARRAEKKEENARIGEQEEKKIRVILIKNLNK